jgi:hypothetical protein
MDQTPRPKDVPIFNCRQKLFQEFGARPGRKWLDHLLATNPSSDSADACQPETSQPETGPPKPESQESLRTDWMVMSESLKVSEKSFVDAFRKFHPNRESAFTCWMTRCVRNAVDEVIEHVISNQCFRLISRYLDLVRARFIRYRKCSSNIFLMPY